MLIYILGSLAITNATGVLFEPRFLPSRETQVQHSQVKFSMLAAKKGQIL